MNNEAASDILCPHGWRKFDQAQMNMLRFVRAGKNTTKNRRRIHKWAAAMRNWLERIYRTPIE